MSGQSTPILLHRTGNKCKYSQVAVSSFPSDTICIFHVRCAWRCPFKESNVRIHTSIIDTKYHVWLLQQQLANSRRPTSSNDVTPRHAAVASDVYAEFCVIIESNYCRKHIVLFPTDRRTDVQTTNNDGMNCFLTCVIDIGNKLNAINSWAFRWWRSNTYPDIVLQKKLMSAEITAWW